MTDDRNNAYAWMLLAATEMVLHGDIRAFHATYCRDRGRVIFVESDQGWDPYPIYQDFPDEVNA